MTVMRQSKFVISALALLALGACHDQSDLAANLTQDPPDLVSAQQIGQLMAKTCLASLPNFANLDKAAVAAGLKPYNASAGAYSAFLLPETNFYVQMTITRKGRVCIGYAESSDSKDAVGKAFLTAARKATGGSGEPQPTSFFAIAQHMPNGSLITQDFRSAPGRRDTNILIVSEPIAKSEIAFFIYN